MARKKAPPPCSWLLSGDFPTGTLASDAPAAARAAQEVSRRLGSALEADGRSLKAVAEQAGVSRATVYSILAGRSYPDFSTLARLGEVLGRSLWPTDV